MGKATGGGAGGVRSSLVLLDRAPTGGGRDTHVAQSHGLAAWFHAVEFVREGQHYLPAMGVL